MPCLCLCLCTFDSFHASLCASFAWLLTPFSLITIIIFIFFCRQQTRTACRRCEGLCFTRSCERICTNCNDDNASTTNGYIRSCFCPSSAYQRARCCITCLFDSSAIGATNVNDLTIIIGHNKIYHLPRGSHTSLCGCHDSRQRANSRSLTRGFARCSQKSCRMAEETQERQLRYRVQKRAHTNLRPQIYDQLTTTLNLKVLKIVGTLLTLFQIHRVIKRC